MLLSLVRIVLGFVLACLAAGLVQALFVITPAEIVSFPGQSIGERAQAAGFLALIAATQLALFSAPFAALTAGIGEWQGIRSALYYAGAGLAIAACGFLTQLAGETGGATVFNSYAFAAYTAAGLSGGLVYWGIAGRRACRRRRPAAA